MVTVVEAATSVLPVLVDPAVLHVAADAPRGPEFGKASPIGIPIIMVLLIATILLVWNMNKRIKNLPDSFDEDNPQADQREDEGTDSAAVDR